MDKVKNNGVATMRASLANQERKVLKNFPHQLIDPTSSGLDCRPTPKKNERRKSWEQREREKEREKPIL